MVGSGAGYLLLPMKTRGEVFVSQETLCVDDAASCSFRYCLHLVVDNAVS